MAAASAEPTPAAPAAPTTPPVTHGKSPDRDADEGISATTLVSGAGAKPTVASLYVGDLDPNVREDQLIEVFRACGPLLGVRVCRDIITQRSLGYAYVNFQNPADAEKALDTLNFTVLGNRRIRVMWQQRDPTLRYSGSGNIFVKNLDEELDHKGLHDLFKAFGSILSCKVMTNEEGKSRRYGFVHFKDEDAANQAIAKMNGKTDEDHKKQDADDAALYVAHFIRRNARIAALMANFTNIYIKQVLPTVDKALVEQFFSKFGGITSTMAKKDAKGRVFAFCNFATHEAAVKCIEELHDQPVDGLTEPSEKVYVARAQSRSERLFDLRQKYMQRQSLGNNLYIRNFDPEFSSDNLRDLFKEFGEITSCRVMSDEKGSSRGFGFVSFGNAEQANHALREMNGRMLNGKPLVVNVAQRRDHRRSMLQVQFQQRLQALLQRLPMMPFIAGAGGLFGPAPRQVTMGGRKQPAGSKQAAGASPPGAGTAAPPPFQVNDALFPPLPGQSSTSAPPQRMRISSKYTVSPPLGAAASAPPAQKQVSPAAGPATPQLPPLTSSDLSSMTPDEQKMALGERLFVRVAEVSEENAPKITGMFLEMEPKDIMNLLNDAEKLNGKIEEALCVLRAHQLKGTGGAPSMKAEAGK